MNAKQLREKRAALIEQMQGMVAAAKAEGRNLSNEENEKFDTINNEVDELRASATRIERAEELKKELASKADEVRDNATPAKVEARDAFNAYLRKGINGLNAAEARAIQELRGTDTQITTTDGLGGFLVPENWSDFISATELFKSDIEQVATVIRTANGQAFNLPANDDTAVVAAILGEGTAATVSDMTFTNVKFEPFTYGSGLVKVSNQLMSDNAFDLASFVGGQLANRLKRGINADLTTGADVVGPPAVSKPQGIVTGSTQGKLLTSNSAITLSEVMDLFYSVDASYRNAPNAGWMMNSSTAKAIRILGFAQTNDFPSYVPGMSVGEPDMLFGKPVYINEDMASIGADAKVILFGDLSQYYIHEAGGVQILRLSERFADSLSTGFIGYRRIDANVLQGSAIKHLVMGS
jgi:HK97 family phage major capsid protein